MTDMGLEALEADASETGSLRLALEAGGRTITTVTAVIEGKNFETQTHQIDVQGANGVISIFFGDLPVSKKYRITLSAADCIGTATFSVSANQVSLVNVPLSCGGGGEGEDTGGVQVTGTLNGGTGSGSSDCDHVLKIVAAPSIQNGAGPVSHVELFLNDGVEPTSIQWTSSSTNGAAGTIGDLSGTTDMEVSFDCSANGTAFVSANVTAPKHHQGACLEQARVSIECLNQVIPLGCGNGVIDTGEVCDTNGANPDVLPAGTPVGSTCNASCSGIVAPPGPLCGNGVINPPEVCDTNGAGADVLPPGTPTTSTCNATCTAIIAVGPVCGNGVIEAGEVCDTNGTGTDVLPPGTPLTSTCNPTCTVIIPIVGACGNGVIDTGEACDTNGAFSDILPTGTPVGSTCNALCTAIIPPSPGAVCGNGTIETGEVCDTNGTGADVLPAGTPAGSTCNTTCTVIIPPAPGAVCGNGVIETGEVCDTNGAFTDVLPPGTPNTSTCNATCTAIIPAGGGAVCGNGTIETGEACDTNGTGADVLPTGTPAGSTCNATCTAIVPPPVGGACLTCAQAKCPVQYSNALGATSSASNTALVTDLFDCVIGPNWEAGGPIPSTSCYFSNPSQPRGTLIPCYCGPTPEATCVATGPADHTQACGIQMENASQCNPASASCVTQSGSNPDVALGDTLQLLNCEKAACETECGFPPVPVDD